MDIKKNDGRKYDLEQASWAEQSTRFWAPAVKQNIVRKAAEAEQQATLAFERMIGRKTVPAARYE
jgi:hypothetical protein